MPEPSLKPLTGTPRELEPLVRRWLDDDLPPDAVSGRDRLTVRTSGSTGEPKDVQLSPAAVRFSAEATLRRIGGPGAWTLALPAHYVGGLQVIVRSILSDSSPVVLAEHSGLPAATAALPQGRRYLAAVPTQLHRWLGRAADVEALRGYDAILVGGAAASEELLSQARDRGVAVITTYGMSETCGGCVYDGVPLDGVAVALGDGGEIRLAGPVLFDGYAGRPDLTAATLRDGWLHTPDLGCLDDDGRLEVLGRADDVVISGGVNVSLPAVERQIRAMSDVVGCAVLGLPDQEWGARVVAFVVARKDGAAPGVRAVRDAVAARHPRTWAPRQVFAVGQIPMLASGKVDRQTLMREAASRE